MLNPLGIIIAIIGIALLIFGISATDSFSSHVSNTFRGTPSDRAMWLIISGIVTIGVGGFLSWLGLSRHR